MNDIFFLYTKKEDRKLTLNKPITNESQRLAETFVTIESRREMFSDVVMKTVIPIVWRMLLVYMRGYT